MIRLQFELLGIISMSEVGALEVEYALYQFTVSTSGCTSNLPYLSFATCGCMSTFKERTLSIFGVNQRLHN